VHKPNPQSQAQALRDAAYASLQGSASTAEARALVDAVCARVAAYEIEHGVRTNGRGAAQLAKLKKATGAFLADLLVVHSGKLPGEWVYRSLHAKSFTGEPISYRIFSALWQALEGLGLIEHKGRVEHWTGVGASNMVAQRWASRFRATPALLALSTKHGVPPAKSADHFTMELPREPLQKRATSSRNAYGQKVHGKLMKFERTSQTEKLEADVRELNEFLSKQEIDGGIHQGYVRIFQNGDDPAFNWNMGGRVYSQPGDRNYQELSRELRLKMQINGEAVSEIDIRASYLTIFLAWHDVQLDPAKDPYAIPGIDSRDVVKTWMTATFGKAGKPFTRWSAEMQAYFQEKYGAPLDRQRYPVSRVKDAVLKHYPALAQLEQPLHGRVRTWADLMYVESVVIVFTMLDLMRKHGVPSLAVHDSLIIPRSKIELATEALKARFRWVTKMEPLISITPEPT